MVGGQRGDGGNEADDESLRKMKTNKQRQLSNQMDSKQSLERGICSESVHPLSDDVEVTAEGLKKLLNVL